MSTGLFSTYRQGENRVTASVIAVLRSLALPHIERLVGALVQETGFELIQFRNQKSRDGDGVPDAEISSDFRILLETKVKRNAVDTAQIRRHLQRLSDGPNQYLIVLTPDEWSPDVQKRVDDHRVVWASFNGLNQAIDDLLKDETGVISERDTFLLRELQRMLRDEGLLVSVNDTVVVAARVAWERYNQLNAYICQPFRSFQKVDHIAFYSLGEIKPLVPRILKKHQGIVFKKGEYDGRLGEIIDQALTLEYSEGLVADVYELSVPEDQRTVALKKAVPNDLVADTGRPIPFTQGQRYVNIKDLLSASTTSDVVLVGR